MKPLAEQTIVITGASSGIGLETALEAGKAGARVVLAARNQEALAEAARKIEQSGGQAVSVVADVSRREDVERIARTAIERFGGFDTWVNDAGLGIWGRLEEVSDEDSRQLFDINFWGVVYGSLEAVKHLKRRGGAIINLGSVASDMAFPLQGMYSASKHAIKAFTNALRRELEDEKAPVSVTLIKPAAIGTPFPNNAKNYTKQEPQLPAPIYSPASVAHAILHAATHRRREMHVGGGGKLISAVGKLMPGVADLASSRIIASQLRKQPAKPRGDNLWEAGEHGGQVRGEHPNASVRPSVYTEASVHPALAGTALAALGVAVGLVASRWMR
jgi:short-subunit dehydrogenase